jgi:hypothetical protein
MAAPTYPAVCPRCNRTVMTCWHRYSRHGVTPDSADYCLMSERRVPITGTADQDYLNRANLLAELAGQVQDDDPHQTWDYLTTLPAVELQRLLQLALAAIPVDRKPTELFGWVLDLPAAQEAS